ncbi:phd transcription [Moniliophthora roreri]|uniref:PHD-type domain-containing protein n=1 Tax=Moniliophthora roreri TaxID=221103 RepID=A0A0W0G2K0_MONRR|nr:phd transcription [Moniliophthora roreri]
MNISSLLCSEDPKPPSSEPRIIPEPVLLAPHLTRNHYQQQQQQASSSSPSSSSQSSKLNLEALVHAADQERRRLQSPVVAYSHPSNIANDRQVEREGEQREKERTREREREREHREKQVQAAHWQQEQQDLFYKRQRQQRQHHREAILSYPSRSPHSDTLSPPLSRPRAQVSSQPPSDPTPSATTSQQISHLLSPTSYSPSLSRSPRDVSRLPPQPLHSEDDMYSPSSSTSVAKKRRHSDHLASDPDVDSRIRKDRELMAPGTLGFGGIPQSSTPNVDAIAVTRRKPGSSGYSYDPVHDQDPPPKRPEPVSTTDDRPKNSIGFLTGGHPTPQPQHSHQHLHQQHQHHQQSHTQSLPQPQSQSHHRPSSREHHTPHHRVVSPAAGARRSPPSSVHTHVHLHGHGRRSPPVPVPVGRRSPPGSHVGRALAARHHDQDMALDRVKQERRESSALPSTPVLSTSSSPNFIKAQSVEPPKVTVSKAQSPPAPLPRKPISVSMESHLQPHSLPGVSLEPPEKKKKSRSRTSNEVVVRKEDFNNPIHARQVSKPSTPVQPPLPAVTHAPSPAPPPPSHSSQPAASTRPAEDDAHEWFLEHFGDDSTHGKRPRSPSPTPTPPSPITSTVRHVSTSKSKSSSPTRVVVEPEDAVTALEQELLEDTPAKEEDNDMDVDELVEEALCDPEEQKEDDKEKAMEVDVEDELLSLVDDRPKMSISEVVKKRKEEEKEREKDKLNSPVASTSASASSPKFRSPSVSVSLPGDRDKDRDSMPPPAAPTASKTSVQASQAGKKRKTAHKPKGRAAAAATPVTEAPAVAKPRAKPGPKPKPRDSNGNIIRSPATTTPTPAPANKVGGKGTPPIGRASAVADAERSRSASVAQEAPEEPEAEEEDDDKLYCVCQTKYDEDRSMIACDSCDEWYHTQCVEIPDQEVDLVDQFVCPVCIAKHPERKLQTTYKPRCLFGLLQPDPDSPKACHKPARTYSKYCSDECGMKNISKRVDTFIRQGGDKQKLWKAVKNAEKREGLVRVVSEDTGSHVPVIKEVKPKKTATEREVERLNGLLDDINKVREELKKGMEIILWREKLVRLATERADRVEECGWDQRLCFSDEDWADYGSGVLESYNTSPDKEAADEEDGDEDKMDTTPDVAGEAEGGEWWCRGDQHCDRHAGWQGLRAKDVAKEKEKKEDALAKLTTKEREIRKHIENLTDGDEEAEPPAPLKSSNKQHHGSTGTAKRKVNGDTAASKKGKKRKAPT